MAREVRITIDDDEVFERMKARKGELDLSWEEVLHRGLRRDVGAGDQSDAAATGPGERSSDPGHGAHAADREAREAHAQAREAHRRAQRAGRDHRATPGSEESIGDVVDEVKDQIRGQVRESIRASMDTVGPADALEREMSELEAAEDAVLRFDAVTDGERRYDVPLRVRLETSRSGMDVTVVAVREGKSVADANRFDPETRRAVNEHLARGGTATLSLGDGASERYEVGPVLSWTQESGDPRVAEVEIEAVLFDDE